MRDYLLVENSYGGKDGEEKEMGPESQAANGEKGHEGELPSVLQKEGVFWRITGLH